MIFHDVPQNSTAWLNARLGIPTASNFNKILTPTGKQSTQASAYVNELVAGLILGEVQQRLVPTYWMERGQLLEDEARKLYEFTTGYTTADGGFATNDTRTAGASPDFRIFDANGR
jgi:hypothetical protein